ncbi:MULTISPECIES: Txe/YoeB family addiction module toxin [Sulfurospirillum]|uniref:Putative mRNA interferase YoeB n=3 Tax=Sulfurospirillum TaxID=57665 RepID=A0A1D7THD5_9BACT|nr:MULTISPECIES: Txe/YoeB family addiction module toxin [Sulfurospirillum]AHJ11910.1 Txe toxin family protein [Sulfurospirillum multivorans DSM 12446]AOO64419.1 Txe toxin family protein [Sulfurospirillum halorespirans DSM 13726]QEH05415.1 Txe toxin family protein [Sulfurospirillum multivorans]
MIIGFAAKGWEDYLYWQENDKKIVKRINLLLEDIKRNPHDSNGIGKPERLKGDLEKYFSRRITAEHRLVYKFLDDLIIVAQCRFHY